MKFSPSKAMDIEMLLAEADMAIERNRSMTSGSGKYRADHHAELATICAMLRDELKEARAQVVREERHHSAAERRELMDDSDREYFDVNTGLIRAAYRMRSPG